MAEADADKLRRGSGKSSNSNSDFPECSDQRTTNSVKDRDTSEKSNDRRRGRRGDSRSSERRDLSSSQNIDSYRPTYSSQDRGRTSYKYDEVPLREERFDGGRSRGERGTKDTERQGKNNQKKIRASRSRSVEHPKPPSKHRESSQIRDKEAHMENPSRKEPSRSRSPSPKRKVDKKKRRKNKRNRSSSSESDTSDSSEDSSSEEDKKRKRHKKAKKHSSEKNKDKKKKKKSKKKKNKEDDSGMKWGKYGVLREFDMFTKDSEFKAWLLDVKLISPDSINNIQTKKFFKEYMEDYNTATLPHEKYYDMAKYEAKKQSKRSKAPATIQDGSMDMFEEAAEMRRQRMEAKIHEQQSVNLSRDQLLEVKRISEERVAADKLRKMGYRPKEGMGVRYID